MPGRLPGLDRFRGLIMVLMALDHAGLLLGGAAHIGDERWGGPYPSGAPTAVFLARLASHLCAPGFCFLMGAGMALFAADRTSRGRSRGSVVGRFVLRGAILVAAQFLLENPTWGLPWGLLWVGYVGVLAMLGLATMAAAPLVFQSAGRLLVLAVASVLGGLALVPAPESWATPVPLWARLLWLPGENAGGVLVNYSLLPWLGVVLAGAAFGKMLAAAGAAGRSEGTARAPAAKPAARKSLDGLTRNDGTETLGDDVRREQRTPERRNDVTRQEQEPPGRRNDVVRREQKRLGQRNGVARQGEGPPMRRTASRLAGTPDGDIRRPWRLLVLAGLALLALFPILRLANGGLATLRPLPLDSWQGFFSLVKYPPSLAFLALTLGAGCLLLRPLQADAPLLAPVLRPLAVFGSAPLFFYVAHLWLFSVTRLVLGHEIGFAGAVLCWLAGLVALQPLCLRYAAFRRAKPPGSVWRLL